MNTNDLSAERTEAEAEKTLSACCGGPAAKDTGGCCASDADAKAAGKTGCGCDESQECC